MLEVSDKYKNKIYTQDSARHFKGEVRFELLDVNAYHDATLNGLTDNDEASISRINQLIDKRRVMSHKYASFEKDYFKLDGSFVIPPRVDEGESKVGWWSRDLCNSDKTFATPVGFAVIFTEGHNSAGLTLTFSSLTNEYATDFVIQVFDNNHMPIVVKHVVDNKNATYVLEDSLDNYYSIVVEILKWSHPLRRAKVTAIDFGVSQTFGNSDLISYSVTEEINVTGDSLPTNELKFTVDNSDRIYNILNPEGHYRFLMERQEVWATLSLEVEPNNYETINMGKFYLKEWKSDEGALTTTFTAFSVFDILEDIMYIGYGATNLYDLAVDVLTKAGVTEFIIDEKLREIATNGFYELIDSRKALYFIGMAGKAIIKQNRDGIVEIQQFKTLDAGTKYALYTGPGVYAGDSTYPVVDQGYDMKNITFKNVYAEPQIKLDQQVGAVMMIVQNFETGVKATYTLKDTKVRNGVTVKHENPLIISESHALDIAKWILRERSLRALYEVNWRQNPALECGDIVLIEDSYGAKKQSRILKQTFEYASYLSGRTETRGGI